MNHTPALTGGQALDQANDSGRAGATTSCQPIIHGPTPPASQSGLTRVQHRRPANINALQQRITWLEQPVINLQGARDDPDEDLDAASAANRELIANPNRHKDQVGCTCENRRSSPALQCADLADMSALDHAGQAYPRVRG